MTHVATRRSFRLTSVLAEYERILVVTHNNPDPDAIATGWAICTLVTECLGMPAKLVAGGAILRAENARMVELLSAPIELVDDVVEDPLTGIVLVDCTVGGNNHLLSDTEIRPVAVVDHHDDAECKARLRYRDVRTRLVACSTIATQYLQEQEIEPTRDLATALAYGIQSDALNNPVLTPSDYRALSWLALRYDFQKMTEIQHAPLPRSYFGELKSALRDARVCSDSGFCFLSRASNAEIVPEMSDILIRTEGLQRVLCAAVVHGDGLVSVRTTAACGGAVNMARSILKGLGRGGGNNRRAGGRIPGVGRSRAAREDLRSLLKTRWLEVCGSDPETWEPLVHR